jgi:RNA polymerase sigma factor (sigma-70 family)
MAASPYDRVHRQVHRLFNFGAIGTMSDAQLLDCFVSRRDEAAEAAFEELVIRHGPMVLRVCRGILHDAHDAEDAFQAVFLVLANRAGTIRGSGSVASWLFGVAHRVATRSKRTASRRRALDQLVAERTSESVLPPETDPDRQILHEEINGLPDQLRAPIVLCYLQGLTYAAASHQLGLSEVAIRGRLARARERLRHRLTRRGLTVPAGLLVAGAAGETQAAIPVTLIHSTIRIALGFLAGNTASILAKGVVNSMLLDKLRVATVLFCLGIGGSYGAWHALASAFQGKGQANPGPAVAKAPATSQPPRTDRYGDRLPAGAAMRLGTVRFRHTPFIRRIVYSPDGQLIVTDSGQHRLLVWDARDGKELRPLDLGIEEIRDFAFSPDGTMIAAVGFHLEPKRNVVVNHLTFTDVVSARPVRRGEWDDQGNVEKIAYAPDGKTVATVSLDGTLRLWDATTTRLLHRERLVGDEKLSPESIAFSPDTAGHLLAITRQRTGTIDLWDVAHLRRARSIAPDGPSRPDCLMFSPDGTTLAAGEATRGSEIRLWRVGDGSLIGRFKSRKNAHVSQMAFSPDGKVLAAIESGGPLVFFDTATGKELDVLSSVGLMDGPLAFSPDGRTLATTGDRQSLHLWELATGKDRLATPEAHLGDVVALACCADGKTLISGSRDRTVRIWDLATGRPTRTLPHDSWVVSLSVSADGSLLATGSAYPEWGKVRMWNPKTGDPLHTWSVEGTKNRSHLLRGLTLTEDGSSVIAALGDGTLRRWDVATEQECPIAQPKLEKLPRIGLRGLDDVDRAVFARDGRSVALSGEGWVQVFDVASGDRLFKETSEPPVCEFAPDGQSLTIVREDRFKRIQAGNFRGSSPPTSTIIWLDSRTGHVRREIEIPDSYVKSLAISPDGRVIAAGTLSTQPARGTIRIFRLRDKQEIQTIESPCYLIEALTFTPDGKQIVAGLADTSIVIWDARQID